MKRRGSPNAYGGTFQSDTGGTTFHSDTPGTFESDMAEAIAGKVFARGAGHGSDSAADAARRTAMPQADFLP